MQVRAFPVHLEIESTNRCNLSCVMCPHRIMKREQVDMSWEIFSKIIDESRGLAKSSYLHMIGEPLLHPNIVDMINYTHDAGIETSISTNVVKLNMEYGERLLNSRLDELVLCLDGVDDKTYRKFRIGGHFPSVKASIDNFIQLRKEHPFSNMKVVVQLIHMKDNADQAEALVREYEQKLYGIGHVLVKGYSRFAGFVDDLGAVPTKPRRFSCSKVHTHIAFQSDGDCVICCRDFEKMTVIGNIKKSSISELWHSDKYNKYRLQFASRNWNGNSLCKDC